MAWTKGFDFRATAIYVTDPADCTYVLDADTYPTTRNSVTFGWETSPLGSRNRNNAIDARLAGVQQVDGATTKTFRVDLPGAADYDVRLAAGDASFTNHAHWEIKDGSTSRASRSEQDVTGGQFSDATGTIRTSAADWVSNNVKSTLTFAGTVFNFLLNPDGLWVVNSDVIAHLWLDQVAAAGNPYYAYAQQ